MEGNFRIPEPMCFDGNVSENWRRFRQKFELYLLATCLGKTIKDQIKIAQLLNLIGDEGLDVFNTFSFEDGESVKFDCVIQKFESYCCPKKNVVFERFKFYKIKQEEGQEFGQFVKQLKLAAKSCEFLERDNMIRDRIVLGIKDKSIQERLLRNTKLDLEKAIEFCSIVETSKDQCKTIDDHDKMNDRRWEQGKVVKLASTPRSYWVEGKDGSVIRRNRIHVKRSKTDQ